MKKAIDRLGHEVADELGTGPDAASRAAQRRAVIEAYQPSSPPRRRHLAVLSLAAVVALLLAGFEFWPKPEPVDFWVGTATTSSKEGASLQALANEALDLRFSEGSTLQLDPRARARVTKASHHQVWVSLDEGALLAQVQPGTGVAWVFEAGPYQVWVKGTVLKVHWASDREGFKVELPRGRVEVHGPGLPKEGQVLEEHHQLEVSGHEARVSVLAPVAPASEALAPKVSAPPLAPPRPPEQVEPLGVAPRPPAPRPPAPQSWKGLAQAGDYASALAAARREGFSTLTGKLGLTDLVLLSDVARYAGSGDSAREALRALEHRFPRTGQASLVPFLLGRIAVDLDDDPAAGARNFKRYMQLNPNGRLAEEAHGRLLDALHQAGNLGEARRSARDYLRRYPQGPHAPLANSLMEGD